ncbi:MAG TPA: HAD family hydrolase [Dehalococcoidia bacterium]|nr:HAD family hydrolase [Dehalococcoidia bacterium]
MTIRAVFFDLDDTLCNTSVSRRDRALLAAKTIAAANPDLDVDELVLRILEPQPGAGSPRGVGPLLADLGVSDTDAGRAARGLWFFQGCEHLVSSFESCLDAIAVLRRNYKLGVITNGRHDVQRLKFSALGCNGIPPELVFASEAVGHDKPDARIFAHALSHAGVRPDEAAFVGDQPLIDIAGAKSAGMFGVWFNPGGLPGPTGIVPDATFSNYNDLSGILSRLSN